MQLFQIIINNFSHFLLSIPKKKQLHILIRKGQWFVHEELVVKEN